MNANRMVLMVVAILGVLVVGSCYAANPADLTVFERFYSTGYVKLISEEDCTTAFAALPPFSGDIDVSLQASRFKETESDKYIARLIKRFSPNFDAALMTDFVSKEGVSDIANRLVLDLHGDVFGLPVGLGAYLPFDDKESFKMGPRITFREFTACLTVAEEGKYLSGINYTNAKYDFKAEVAYGNEDIWYVRASKKVKTSFGDFWPEIRTRFLPGEQIFGVGLLMYF